MASASQESGKLFMVYCYADMQPSEEGEDRSCYFSYLLRAGSVEEVGDICAAEFAKFPLDGEPFQKGDALAIEEIVEIEDIPAQGVMLDCKVMQGDYSFVGGMAPFSEESDGIIVYEIMPEDDDEEAEQEALVILGEE
ncbi:MAG: hypothetical protein K9K65_08035 [Desulfarculaceae bacterium]|nr:hypothetical protein [Desulfarculaceae bacterium]MCF8048076.1 hypothetical protein [Desulfarculaceae bacterium]MCF8097775.1 hypothetical protein [Desulfarculaceae bacterium]MCF8123661.1 hypothetical protein [Desulfarculaceae bacterium]